MRGPAANRRPGWRSPRRRPCGTWAGRGAGRRRPWPAGRRAPASRRGSVRPRRPLRRRSRAAGRASRPSHTPGRVGSACPRRARCSAAPRAAAAGPPTPAAASARGLARRDAAIRRGVRSVWHSSAGPARRAARHSSGSKDSGSASGVFCSRISTFCSASLSEAWQERASSMPRSNCLQRFFERQFPVLEPFDDGFEFAERLFEIGGLCFLAGHGGLRGAQALHRGRQWSTQVKPQYRSPRMTNPVPGDSVDLMPPTA